MRKALIISGMILLVLMVAAGSFWGGMKYESNRADRVRTNFMNARGPSDLGEFPQFGQSPGSGMPEGMSGNGGTMGQVKTVEGNVLMVSTAEDVTTVHLNDETQIWKSVTTDTSDLQPGMRVRVTGERDEAGDITAQHVTILSDEFPIEMIVNPADAAPPETEP